MPRNIRLMPDYYCWPLWDMDSVGNLDPNQLPITPELRVRLQRWAEAYDATLNLAEPQTSVFASEDAERAYRERFAAEGEAIWRELRAQLGPSYRVYYRDETTGDLRAPNEGEAPSG